MIILQQLLPVFMANIVGEKEQKITEMMAMMGLQMRVYWSVLYLFNYVLFVLSVSKQITIFAYN